MRASFLSASFQPQHLRASQPSHTMSFSDVCDASSRYFNANFIPLFSTLSSDEHDLAVARQEIIALKKKYSDLELLHQQVSTELQGREQQIEDLTIELHVRQQDLDETTIEVQDLRQLANQVASQLQGEIQESKDMSNSIDNYERERSEMIEEIYSLRSQNSSLQISNDRLTRMIGDAGSFFARTGQVLKEARFNTKETTFVDHIKSNMVEFDDHYGYVDTSFRFFSVPSPVRFDDLANPTSPDYSMAYLN